MPIIEPIPLEQLRPGSRHVVESGCADGLDEGLGLLIPWLRELGRLEA